jgi:hypothetical protein
LALTTLALTTLALTTLALTTLAAPLTTLDTLIYTNPITRLIVALTGFAGVLKNKLTPQIYAWQYSGQYCAVSETSWISRRIRMIIISTTITEAIYASIHPKQPNDLQKH